MASDDEIDSESQEELLKPIMKKTKLKPKKGRRSTWDEEMVDDLVNIICEDDYLKRKLIFENTKNTRNSDFYIKIIKEVKKCCERRSKTFPFTVEQTRTKFKSCISTCKNAAMTIKCASGIKRFQEDKNLGKWFNQLYPLVKSRESAQPEQAIEPSSLTRKNHKGNSRADDSLCDNAASATTPGTSSSNTSTSEDSTESNLENGDKKGTATRKRGRDLYVPVKDDKRKKSDDAISTIAASINKLTEKDNNTTDLLNFFREENERQRKHEMELYKMQMDLQMQMQIQMMQLLSQQQQPQPQSQSLTSHQQYQQMPVPPTPSFLGQQSASRPYHFGNSSQTAVQRRVEAVPDKTYHNLETVQNNTNENGSYYQLLNN